jgi:23S rRNA maturation mini-RNase III
MNLAEQLQTELMRKGLNDDSKKGLKAASNNKVMNVFKHLFTKAVEWEMVEAETLKRIRKVKLFKEPKAVTVSVYRGSTGAHLLFANLTCNRLS